MKQDKVVTGMKTTGDLLVKLALAQIKEYRIREGITQKSAVPVKLASVSPSPWWERILHYWKRG